MNDEIEYGAEVAPRVNGNRTAKFDKTVRQKAGAYHARALHTPNAATHWAFVQHAVGGFVPANQAVNIVSLFTAMKAIDARTLSVAARGSEFASDVTDESIFEQAKREAGIDAAWQVPLRIVARLRSLI